MRIGWKTSVPVVAVLAVGVAGGITYAKGDKPGYALVAAGEAKFAPLDPKTPGSPQVAVLSGDIKTGPVALFLKLSKGVAPVHWHSSDYYALSVEGTTKHWLPGKEAEAKANPPGSFWFQPGGVGGAHGDECVSDSCTIFVQMPGKFDFTPVEPARTTAAKPASK